MTGTPDFYCVALRIHDILEMSCHGCSIYGCSASWRADAFSDVEDDACETIFIKVNFLVVGDLADSAVDV